jgi:hypothetical protein
MYLWKYACSINERNWNCTQTIKIIFRCLVEFLLCFYLQYRPAERFFFSPCIPRICRYWSVTLIDTIKIISITAPSVIKMYLYVCMPLHVSVNINHHQKANQHRKETTITWYKITSVRFYRIFVQVKMWQLM